MKQINFNISEIKDESSKIKELFHYLDDVTTFDITATIALLISLSVVFYLSRYKPFLKKITPKVKNVILK